MNGELKFMMIWLFTLGLMHEGNGQVKENKVVLLMPFCSKLTLANPMHSDIQLSNLSREYYQGLLIALDSLEQANIAVNLTVLDTENDSMTVVRHLNKQPMKDAELIIGPVFKSGNKMIGEFVKGRDVFHVSPLMTFSKPDATDMNTISSNPYISSYGRLIVKQIKITQPETDDYTIIVISDKSSLDKTITAGIKQAAGKTTKIKIIDVSKLSELSAALSATQPKYVVIPSSSEKVVTEFFNSIKDTSLFNNLSLYGLPQWLDFKNVNYVQWQQANIHIGTPFYIDYTKEEVRNFIRLYREKYFTDPSEAAFKGYDQALVFITCLNSYHKKMLAKIADFPLPALHTQFNISQNLDKGGYQNYYLNWLTMQQYKLIKLKD